MPVYQLIRRSELWFWLLLVALGCVLLGIVPLTGRGSLAAILERTWHIVVFLAAITVVADLCHAAGLFDVVGRFIAARANGNTLLLYCGIVVLGLLCTTILSLDTTAVLLTPVVIRMCVYAGLHTLPFALAAIWLANAGSLILPVSNLTNLLAMHRLDISALAYLQVMWLPGLVAAIVPVLLIAIVHGRTLRQPSRVIVGAATRDRVLLWASGAVILAIVPAVIANLPVDVVAAAALLAMLAAFALRHRAALGWHLVPWRLVLLTFSLFIAMTGFTNVVGTGFASWAVGASTDLGGLLRTAFASAVAANLFNNLPAYLMIEQAVPLHANQQLFAVLIGVNAGPGILVHGSLATLLWLDRCRKEGVTVSRRYFAVFGLLAVSATLPLSTLALWWTLSS